MLKIENIKMRSNLSEIAYAAIKKSILTAELNGSADPIRVDERALAEQLGVSRTPIREATRQLAAEGFIKMIPRQGIYVAVKTKQDIIDVLLVRSVLEGLAAGLAAKNATKEDVVKMKAIFTPFLDFDLDRRVREYSEANIAFHEFVLEKSQCRKLVEIAGNLFDQMRMIRIQTANYPNRLKISLSEHLKIIEAIKKKDSDLAEKLMQQHIKEVIKGVEENLISGEERGE